MNKIKTKFKDLYSFQSEKFTDNRDFFRELVFAHGFMGMKNKNTTIYGCTNYRHKESESGIKWSDSSLKIKWSIKKTILSEKDKKNKLFNFYFG